MRLAVSAVSVVAGALCASAVAGQTRPDFSGRWTTQPDPAAAPPARDSAAQGARGARGGGRGGPVGDMGSGWGSTITIAQDAGRLTVEYMYFVRGDMQPPLRFIHALDGSETKNTVMMGRGVQVQTARTAWRGDTLVITTMHTFPHPETGQPAQSEVIRALSLESASSLVVETTRAGVLGGPASTTRTVYRKL